MQQLGFTLPRETMANWIIYVAEHYFYPIYDRLHEELLKRDLVHADETTCQVLREKGQATKAFLLPQKNPMDYYTSSIYSFNTPDFTSAPVEIDNREVGASILSEKRTETKVR